MNNEILTVPPKVAGAYIKNVADSLMRLMPSVDENARANLEESIRTLLRTSVHLDPAAYGIDFSIDDQASEAFAICALEDVVIKLLAGSGLAEAASGGRGFDEAALLAYLRSHPLGGDATEIVKARLLAGGRSKQTVLLELKGTRNLPAELVVRRDWASSVTGTSVVSEFELLRVLHARGIKVPKPVLLESGSAALGSPFIIVTRLSGKALGDPFTPPLSTGPVFDLAEQLGKIHSLDAILFEGLPGIPEQNVTTGQLREKLAVYAAVIAQLGAPSATIDLALEWLGRHVDNVECDKRLVHADLGFHNLLCDGEELGAILDWELAHVGNPALDLGYLRSVVTQKLEWNEFLAAYHAAGGPDIPAKTIDFFTLFASIWLYQLLLQARAAIAGRHIADVEIAHVCAHFIPALLARISRELVLVKD